MYRNPGSEARSIIVNEEPSPIRVLQINADDYAFVALRATDFKNMIGPGVYAAVIRHKDRCEWLYIGSAQNIMRRISDDGHTSLRIAMSKSEAELVVFLCRSEMHARTMESDLIAQTMPTLNIIGKSESSPSVKAFT